MVVIDSRGIAESKLFARMRRLKALTSNNSPVSLSPPFVKMLTVEPITGAVGGVGITGVGLLAGFLGVEVGRGFFLFCAPVSEPTQKLRSKMKMIFIHIKNLRLVGSHNRKSTLCFI